MRQDGSVDPGATGILLFRCIQVAFLQNRFAVSANPTLSRPGRLLLPSQEDIPQHDRVVMKFVTRGEYKRDRAFACRGTQLRKRIGMIANLRRVAAAEFLPACRIVSEPLT